jgi:hypothetical protein
VTYAKIQNVAAARLLGNPSATVSASASEISLGATFLFTGTALQTASATGDVTWASNSFATTIANAAVTLAKMSSLAASSFIGNNTGSAATPVAVSTTSLAGMIAALGAAAQVQPSNPTATSSLTGVMMGLGSTCKITPSYSTRVLALFNGIMTNSVSGDGAQVGIKYGTGTAPSNASAVTGTSVGAGIACSVAAAGQLIPFSTAAVITGLTAGTQYWVDLQLLALTGGSATIVNLGFTAHEF